MKAFNWEKGLPVREKEIRKSDKGSVVILVKKLKYRRPCAWSSAETEF